MKRLSVLIVLISLGIPFAGHSQSDTICLPIAQAKRMLVRVEQGKADSAELSLRKMEIIDLRAVVGSQQTTVKDLQSFIQTKDLQIGNYKMQADILSRALKKQKRKTIMVIIGGILITSSLSYLLITK